VNLFDVPRELIYAFLFILGSCFGSFLNVCIYRFPSRAGLWDQLRALNTHSSGCPKCSCSIRWHDNIPILGWLMLRGRCRQCRFPISVRYPLIETLTALLFCLIYWCEMPVGNGWLPENSGLFDDLGPQLIRQRWASEAWLNARCALHLAMICGLIVATFIDIDLKIIPDGCTVPLMLTAVVAHTGMGQLFIVPLWFQDPSSASVVRSICPAWLQPFVFQWDGVSFLSGSPHLHGLLVSLAGFVVGGGIVWIVRLAGFWVLRQEAMGFGDVVLMAMIGSVIGWQPVVIVFFIAPVLAIGAALIAWMTRRHREIPYGPWLSLATLVLLPGWSVIWPSARRVFEMGPMLLPMAILMTGSLVLSLQAVQLVKRILGIPLYPQDETSIPAWTSADHLMFYNSERPDLQTGQWSRREWEGCRAGRGLQMVHQWRNSGRGGRH
jgi:leader peptidase (prepilin peptidase) / N-methyltransferase